jgi:hypothetical protein
MRINKVAFPEAVRMIAELAGTETASGGSSRPRPPARPTVGKTEKPPASQPEGPSGLSLADALALVTEAAGRLWTSEGVKALAYLHGRGLNDETIKASRLGWTLGVMIPTREGDRCFREAGITIPWHHGDRLTKINIRRPEGSDPKYRQAFGDRPRIFPDPTVIEPGRPLVIVEGEFDALLLGQELRDLAAVVTLGSASNQPDPGILALMLAAAPWFVATDADDAGNKAALEWPARAIRVRPPKGKDWTDAAQAGIDLRRWWTDRLRGTEAPAPPAAEPELPGIIIDQPEPEPYHVYVVDSTGTAELMEAVPSVPRRLKWTAPGLTDDEVAALEAILGLPAGAQWPPLGNLIEEGRRHNAAVLAGQTGRKKL